MREIKFRVWDKEENRMLSSRTIDKLLMMEAINKEIVDTYTIEQYTGLKDKNGVEIYEGDIVSGVCINASIQYCNVEFIGGCFLVVQQSGEKLVELLDNNKKVCEVIGNIHEDKSTTVTNN